MEIEKLSSIFGVLAVTVGAVLAVGTWYFGIAFRKSRNKWLYGLRFTLWSIVLPMFVLGGGHVLRLVLGTPGEPFRNFLLGLLGWWLLGSLILFPVGVLLGRRRERSVA